MILPENLVLQTYQGKDFSFDENNRVIEIFGMGENNFYKDEVYKKIMKKIEA